MACRKLPSLQQTLRVLLMHHAPTYCDRHAGPAPSPHHAASPLHETGANVPHRLWMCGRGTGRAPARLLPRIAGLQRRIHNDGLLVVCEHVATHLRLQPPKERKKYASATYVSTLHGRAVQCQPHQLLGYCPHLTACFRNAAQLIQGPCLPALIPYIGPVLPGAIPMMPRGAAKFNACRSVSPHLQVAVLCSALPWAQYAGHLAALEEGVGLIVMRAHHTGYGQGVVVALVVPHKHQDLEQANARRQHINCLSCHALGASAHQHHS